MALNSEVSTTRKSQKCDTAFLVVTVIALLLRVLIALLVWHVKPASWLYGQASELGEVAHSVATAQGLASPFGHSTGPSAFLPPGYPLFVGLVFKVFGSYSRSAELVLLIMQSAFGAGAVWFTMLFAREFVGRTKAGVVGVLLAIHPWLIALSFVFWETSFSLMMLPALLYVTLVWAKRPTAMVGYLAAALGAVAIAVNASTALTVFALLVWIGYCKRRSLAAVVLPYALFAVLCLVWPIRNVMVMHAFVPLRDNLGYELWQGNRPDGDGFFAPELHPNVNGRELALFERQGELRYMAEKSALAKKAIAADPARFVGLTVKRVLCFWFGVSRQTYKNQIFIASVTSLLGFGGLIAFIRRHGLRTVIPALIPLVLFPAPYYVTHPDFRFRCLLAPVLTVFVVYLVGGRKDAEEIT